MTKDEFIAWDKKDGEVEFAGSRYLLVKKPGARYAPLATRQQYENFEISFACAYDNGDIMRYEVVIGSLADLSPAPEERSET